jgi:Domain of unknown function (DUF5666)
MRSASPFTPRTVFGVVALAGATALSLAACGSSNKANPVQPPAPASPSSTAAAAPTPAPTQAPPSGGNQRVSGLIASVSGGTIQVTAQSGNAGTSEVDFTPSTTVNEVSAASLPDVTPGSCVTLRPARGQNPQSGAFTVQMVRVSPAVGGSCPQPEVPPAGSTPPPAPPGGPSGRGNHPPILGTVASVAGDTITVNTSNPSGLQQATVTVTDRTRYTKQAASNAQAIAQGKCITAQGTENSGTLQATTISLRPANNGSCEGGGGPHRH